MLSEQVALDGANLSNDRPPDIAKCSESAEATHTNSTHKLYVFSHGAPTFAFFCKESTQQQLALLPTTHNNDFKLSCEFRSSGLGGMANTYHAAKFYTAPPNYRAAVVHSKVALVCGPISSRAASSAQAGCRHEGDNQHMRYSNRQVIRPTCQTGPTGP